MSGYSYIKFEMPIAGITIGMLFGGECGDMMLGWELPDFAVDDPNTWYEELDVEEGVE